MRFGLIILAVSPLCGQALDGSEKQRALGAQLNVELRQRVSVLSIPEASEYLGRLAARIVAQLPGDRLTCTFAIIADDTLGDIHEPIALPGGYFFVPAKLFFEARSGSEFAGMIAHAIAHLALPNHGIAQWMFPVLAGDAYPSGLAQKQRSIEREADTIAVQAMAKSGYDPQALVDYIGRVQPAWNGRIAESPLPLRDDRVAGMRRMIERIPARSYAGETEFGAAQDAVRRAVR